MTGTRISAPGWRNRRRHWSRTRASSISRTRATGSTSTSQTGSTRCSWGSFGSWCGDPHGTRRRRSLSAGADLSPHRRDRCLVADRGEPSDAAEARPLVAMVVRRVRRLEVGGHPSRVPGGEGRREELLAHALAAVVRVRREQAQVRVRPPGRVVRLEPLEQCRELAGARLPRVARLTPRARPPRPPTALTARRDPHTAAPSSTQTPPCSKAPSTNLRQYAAWCSTRPRLAPAPPTRPDRPRTPG